MLLVAACVAEASPALAQATPVLQSVASRKTHGAAGVFDLPLAADPANPTTEPRLGPAHLIVFTFDAPVTAATAALIEGSASLGTPTWNGAEVDVPLTGVADAQYVTVALTGVATTAGTGGSGTVRIGFLGGDANQSRAVTVADIGLVNAQLAQPVTAANFLRDINASGTLTVADKALANASATRALPPPVDLAPYVVSTVPAAGATGVSPAASLTLAFSEPVTVSGAWFAVACGSGVRTPADMAVSGDLGAHAGTTFTLTPGVPFAPGDVCTMTIFAAGVTDLDTIDPPDQMAADYVFGFAVQAIGGLFEAPLPWNKDVSALPPSSRSAAIIAALQGAGGWGNGNRLQIDFSIALLDADGTTPRRTVNAPAGGYCYGGPDCDPVPLQMPIPANGNAEGSAGYTCDTANNDCHVLVVEHTEKKLYELYNATAVSATTMTALGAFVWDLTRQYTDVLRGEQCTSADAAGLPIAALLPTADEVAAGVVPHALRFILPNARMKHAVYVHPATHAGAPSSLNADAPPYGVRFRLKASFDETPYSAGARVILRAMKKYGMILSDGGNIALTFADDRLSANKWSALGIVAQTFNSIAVTNFDVVDLGSEIPLTYDCVRAP